MIPDSVRVSLRVVRLSRRVPKWSSRSLTKRETAVGDRSSARAAAENPPSETTLANTCNDKSLSMALAPAECETIVVNACLHNPPHLGLNRYPHWCCYKFRCRNLVFTRATHDLLAIAAKLATVYLEKVARRPELLHPH